MGHWAVGWGGVAATETDGVLCMNRIESVYDYLCMSINESTE